MTEAIIVAAFTLVGVIVSAFITNGKTVSVVKAEMAGNNAARVGVDLIADWKETGAAYADLSLTGTSVGEIDISSFSGVYPIGIQAQSNNSGTSTTTVTLFSLTLA